MPDIEALVAEAEDTAKQIYADYGDIHAANVMERLVVALERMKAVVETARELIPCIEKLGPFPRQMEHGREAIKTIEEALAALDAPPEGEG